MYPWKESVKPALKMKLPADVTDGSEEQGVINGTLRCWAIGAAASVTPLERFRR
jgi:hypothetical protein